MLSPTIVLPILAHVKCSNVTHLHCEAEKVAPLIFAIALLNHVIVWQFLAHRYWSKFATRLQRDCPPLLMAVLILPCEMKPAGPAVEKRVELVWTQVEQFRQNCQTRTKVDITRPRRKRREKTCGKEMWRKKYGHFRHCWRKMETELDGMLLGKTGALWKDCCCVAFAALQMKWHKFHYSHSFLVQISSVSHIACACQQLGLIERNIVLSYER